MNYTVIAQYAPGVTAISEYDTLLEAKAEFYYHTTRSCPIMYCVLKDNNTNTAIYSYFFGEKKRLWYKIKGKIFQWTTGGF